MTPQQIHYMSEKIQSRGLLLPGKKMIRIHLRISKRAFIMKKIIPFLVIQAFIVTFSASSETASNSFVALKLNERLNYSIKDSSTDPDKFSLSVFAYDNKKHERQIFEMDGYNFMFKPDNQSKTGKWLLFSVVSQKGEKDKPYINDLYFIDGLTGCISRLYSTTNLDYLLNNSATIICLYDFLSVITSYSIHYTKLYDGSARPVAIASLSRTGVGEYRTYVNVEGTHCYFYSYNFV